MAKAQVNTQQDRITSDTLAMQLLAPVVSEDEQDEYQGYDLSICRLFEILTLTRRYIDQCEEFSNAQTLRSERKDLGVYQNAIDASNGLGLDRCKEETIDNYVTFVAKARLHEGQKELLVAYNYEKWISGYA